uniref:Protein N-terminal glutamine amidohydrolase n=1 Tax=Odontella aurita TaxID=265563 RepID=A0A7S4JI62_9STRA|mmetsp:Transcript_46533/g.140977  ORF Transcript_46533/g.140977 Transcript_46533/m.140977 type:complete len:316 (+) Transcript_46533:201-1148(+)
MDTRTDCSLEEGISGGVSQCEDRGSDGKGLNRENACREEDILTSAARTALSCPSDRELRVPCYCEENVWRLAYRRLHGGISVGDGGEILYESGACGVQYYVMFISNDERVCPMLCQLAKENESEPCFWDYHVVLLRVARRRKRGRIREVTSLSEQDDASGQNTILDMDSRLPFGCSIEEYVQGSFRGLAFIHPSVRPKYAPLFRVITAEMFLKHFYSDRLHMYDESTGEWHAPPPKYDCIMKGWCDDKVVSFVSSSTAESSVRRSNLDEFISMAEHTERNTDGQSSLANEEENQNPFGEILTLQQLMEKYGNNST